MIKILPLGAGQDVGRSCVIVALGGKKIMFDCGMHMGFQDSRRFPDFTQIQRIDNPDQNPTQKRRPYGQFQSAGVKRGVNGLPVSNSTNGLKKEEDVNSIPGIKSETSNEPSKPSYDDVIDLCIITHFHLDHCGALPHFTEQCGFSGPILMTAPTRAIAPILLDDFRRISGERKGDASFFTAKHITECMDKVRVVRLHESVFVNGDKSISVGLSGGMSSDNSIEVRAYYAGHVLGAAMFYVRVGAESVLYTGDYNMTPDRHLGAAWLDPTLKPTVCITESTYATTIRDSKRARERDFLRKVHDCVRNGGKVLIPVFALGRAQELCCLLDAFWEQMQLRHVPVYFSAGMTARANQYYRLFVNWTNQKIREQVASTNTNPFDFKQIKPWDPALAEQDGPMVLFATPGMLHIGVSLEAFKRWAPSEKNMLIMPGYCVAGTVGAKVLAGAKRVDLDIYGNAVDVNMKIENLSFSAHADAKGILQLLRWAGPPKHVVLVHGEKKGMVHLRERVKNELGVECHMPANHECISLKTDADLESSDATLSSSAIAMVANSFYR